MIIHGLRWNSLRQEQGYCRSMIGVSHDFDVFLNMLNWSISRMLTAKRVELQGASQYFPVKESRMVNIRKNTILY